MRDSMQHWLYSTLVFASGLFVGVDQVQPLYESDRQLPWETAGFPMPQQLADLTIAEVEDIVPAMAPVLAPIFGAIGVSRYPTKPIAMAVLVHPVSICTYLQGSQPLTYSKVLSAIMSGEMPQAYTTIETEKQLEENLMGLLRGRTRKANPLLREHGPVNWYAAPLSMDGCPFRFPWSQENLRKMIKVSASANPNLDPLYFFRCITFPNRYWKDPVGWPRASPVGRAPDCRDHQLQHLDLVRVPGWIESATQVRQRNLKCRIAPFKRDPVWQPEGKMTMSGDMQLVMHDIINTVRMGGAVLRNRDCQFPQLEKSLRAPEPSKLGVQTCSVGSRQQSGGC